MPGPVIPNPTPDWLKPENASVTDTALTKAMRMIGHLIGADNPTAQVLGLMMTDVPGGSATGGLAKAVEGLKARVNWSAIKSGRLTLGEVPSTGNPVADSHRYLTEVLPERFKAYRSVWVKPGEQPNLSNPGGYWAETPAGAARSGYPPQGSSLRQVIIESPEMSRADLDVPISAARRRQFGEPELVFKTNPTSATVFHDPAQSSPPIKAYHGSPHDFERFSLEKIGTGEGAQAYGHGLYFAENPSVAKDYQKALSPENRYALNVNGERLSFRDAAKRALGDKTGGDLATYYESGDAARRLKMDQMSTLTGLGDKLKQQGHQVEYTPLGRMYEVAIHADPEDFLDWDKPLSQQSEKVKQAARQIGQGAGAGPTKVKMGAFVSGTEDPARGVVAKGEDLYRAASDYGVKSAEATVQLKQAGIPGIKYLDQGSRQATPLIDGQPIRSVVPKTSVEARALDALNRNTSVSEAIDYLKQDAGTEAAQTWLQSNAHRIQQPSGTRNYVVFDDQLISILKKYGLLLPAAGLGAEANQR